jgi:hypothetical protein
VCSSRQGKASVAFYWPSIGVIPVLCAISHTHTPLKSRCCAAHTPPHPTAAPSARLAVALQQIKPDFSNYDDAGAWPYLLDEFVEYMKKKNGMQVD